MGATRTPLTTLAHGGGCGCKLAPAVLQELLHGKKAPLQFPGLLVGTETGDDAAVWRINDDTCIIAPTDFFMPMVDDPFDFGRIAAATTPGSRVTKLMGPHASRIFVVSRAASRISPKQSATMEWFSLKLWMSKPIASDPTAIAAPLNAG